jgi:hypothetical protein
MIRAAGARDVGLGAGALAALRGYSNPGRWSRPTSCDATDVVATRAARRELGPARSLYAIAVWSASTAVAAAYLIGQAKAPSSQVAPNRRDPRRSESRNVETT